MNATEATGTSFFQLFSTLPENSSSHSFLIHSLIHNIYKIQPTFRPFATTKSALPFTRTTSITKISFPTSISNSLKDSKISPPIKRKMDFRIMGLESPIFSTLQHVMDLADEADKSFSTPTRAYVRDAKAMAATPADVKEYPNSYVFVVDMPGLKVGDIQVQVEDDNVLLISGERKREEEKEAKYVRMERRVGKLMRKFVLPENANIDAISAVCQDGVLTVTVQKLPPPQPKKPKIVEVKVN
ncbi:hypothetical protein IC575_015933 [Cucumis melo]